MSIQQGTDMNNDPWWIGIFSIIQWRIVASLAAACMFRFFYYRLILIGLLSFVCGAVLVIHVLFRVGVKFTAKMVDDEPRLVQELLSVIIKMSLSYNNVQAFNMMRFANIISPSPNISDLLRTVSDISSQYLSQHRPSRNIDELDNIMNDIFNQSEDVVADENTGDVVADENAGDVVADENVEDKNAADENVEDKNAGDVVVDENVGDKNAGDVVADENAGDENAGDENAGDENTGDVVADENVD